MDLGTRLGDAYTDTLRHALALNPQGWALEFGVAGGDTLRLIAKTMPVVGFDSFEGLPEDWRDGFPAGKFACPAPEIPNAELVVGLFADTLPAWTPPGPIGLVHIDCDLYSSTVTVLDHIGPLLAPGCLIVFDEFHGYPTAVQHEALAWAEYAQRTGTTWETIGHGPEQVAIRLT